MKNLKCRAAQLLLCTITTLLLASATSAQTPAPLRLGDLYAVARTTPRIDAAKAVVVAARARIPSSKLPPDPELQLGFMNRSLPSLRPMDPLGMTQIQLMQMIPLPGKLRLAGRIASAQASAAIARATDIEWDVRSRVAMVFYDLYRIDRSLSITRETKRVVQDIARTAQSMYSVGQGRQADVLRSQIEVARMTEEITRMETMLLSMQGRLAATLNLPLDTVQRDVILPSLPDTLPPLAQLIQLAESNRPMILAGQKDLDARMAGERLASKEILPDLQLGVQYGQNRSAMGTERMGSLMIGASLPIYARSRQLRMREEASAMKIMAAADLAAMRADTRGRVTELYADFTRAHNLIALYRTTVIPQAKAAITASLAAYRVGEVNFMTLRDNQLTVNTYQQELFTLEAEKGKAIAELEMMLGKPLFDATESGNNNARTGQ